jgi:hypothetical protein
MYLLDSLKYDLRNGGKGKLSSDTRLEAPVVLILVAPLLSRLIVVALHVILPGAYLYIQEHLKFAHTCRLS